MQAIPPRAACRAQPVTEPRLSAGGRDHARSGASRASPSDRSTAAAAPIEGRPTTVSKSAASDGQGPTATSWPLDQPVGSGGHDKADSRA